MEKKIQELKTRLAEISHIDSALSVLSWDQSTYMPEKGAANRGAQMATLSRIAHQKSTDPAIGRLLDDLASYESSLPYAHDDASLIRVARIGYDRITRIPENLMAEFSEHSAISYNIWAAARPENDFAKVQPILEKTLELSRNIAECFPGYEHIADPLIDFADFGMKASTVREVFSDLRTELVPLVAAITGQEPADDQFLRRHFPKQPQLDFGLAIARDYGYDLERGRLDETHHPFETRFSTNDIRITTRVDEHDLANCLFSILHEAGHAMYEQGVDPAYDGTPLGSGTSAGVHESQSRLWENMVGRSRGFWEHYYPKLQRAFPGILDDISLDKFYRAINKVQRSLIRTEADEVTYNLHVMLRFELELQLLEGTLLVKDLPEVWRIQFKHDLGIPVPDDKNGVMQDVHWYAGTIGGAFQGYTLGNIMSGLFYASALDAHPEIEDEIRHGKFSTLHSWLVVNIYRHGSKFTASDLLEQVTSGPLRIDPYIAYLKKKFGELYQL